MSVATIKKRPSEKFPIGFIFDEPEIVDGESISSALVTITPVEVGGLELVGSPIIEPKQVSQLVQGGEEGHDYYVKYEITTSTGNIFQGTIIVFVREETP